MKFIKKVTWMFYVVYEACKVYINVALHYWDTVDKFPMWPWESKKVKQYMIRNQAKEDYPVQKVHDTNEEYSRFTDSRIH